MKAINKDLFGIDELEKRDDLTEEYLKSLSSLNCRFYVQQWENQERARRPKPVKGPIDLFWALSQSDEIRRNLIKLFTGFSNILGEAERFSNAANQSADPPVKNRDEEMKWLENNKELVHELAGNWIVVEGGQLIASSPDFAVALRESKVRGIEIPFVLYVPESRQGGTIGI